MKRQMLFGTMLSVALSIGLSAQAPQNPPAGGGQSQPPTSQPQTPRTTPSDQSSERTMTLTGCVQAGSGGAGAGAAAGAGAQSSSFTLTSIKPAGSAGSSTAPGATAGTAGTSGATASSYRLTGEDVQQYVGKRVEVTGTVAGRAGSSATGAAGAGASSADSTPSFRVTSVKPATGDCK